MPLLFCLGVHDSLSEVKSKLQEGEHVFAFLDDVYAVADPDRIRPIYDLLAETLASKAGISLHAGKTRVWSRA
eukprot:6000973-Karenia_brevis.AAC.1